MELGVSHVQNLSSLTPIVDNIFDKYNKNLVPIRSLSDHDIKIIVRYIPMHGDITYPIAYALINEGAYCRAYACTATGTSAY